MLTVYLLRVDFPFALSWVDELREGVSKQRRHRSDRYRRKSDQIRCLLAEKLLRRALGEAGLTTDQMETSLLPGGKPVLNSAPLGFNVSHAGDWVVCAISDSHVGVDVEDLRNAASADEIAAHLAGIEQAYIYHGAFSEVRQRAYRVWSLKESHRKYLGTGLRDPLTADPIQVTGSTTARLAAQHQPELLTSKWLDDDHVCSVCASQAAGDPVFVVVGHDELIQTKNPTC